jgi:hypothetical protein
LNRPDGAPDGKLHTYLLKSDSIVSMSVKLTEYPATFSSKASIIEVETVDLVTGVVTHPNTSVDGGAIMQLAMHDVCRTGGCSTYDTAAITVQNSKTGGVWFSSNWIGMPPKTVEKATIGHDTISVQ